MECTPLTMPDAFAFTPKIHGDDRGGFLEYVKADVLHDAIGHRFDLAQGNCSYSAAGVTRGVHFADVPPGQAKYVTCAHGAILDVVVDIRVGSPTFGAVDTVRLDSTTRRAVYVGEGLGHAFVALTEGATVLYLCSTGYNPTGEHGINPLDPELGIPWPTTGDDGQPLSPTLSAKDQAAPTLAEAQEQGLLPIYSDVRAYIDSL